MKASTIKEPERISLDDDDDHISSAADNTVRPQRELKVNRRIVHQEDEKIKLPDMENPQEPEWYRGRKKSTSRPKTNLFTSSESILSSIRTAINNCEKFNARNEVSALDTEIAKLCDRIHQAAFTKMNHQICRDNHMLSNTGGLSRIFCAAYSGGVIYPWYIQQDAAELYTKWWTGEFEDDLSRGLEFRRTRNKEHSISLNPSYPFRFHGNFFGNAHLRCGQWWPSMICAVRDGAHNAIQAGIAGSATEGEGAWSVVLSGGKYKNEDDGDVVWYYGTDSTDPAKSTTHTQCLMASVGSSRPIRLIRSAEAKNSSYRPCKGYRYDGLYTAVEKVLESPVTHTYRFHLVRCPDQDPIRWRGPGERPTAQEQEAYDKFKEERGFWV